MIGILGCYNQRCPYTAKKTGISVALLSQIMICLRGQRSAQASAAFLECALTRPGQRSADDAY